MQLQRLTEELLLTVTSLNRSCIPQSVQEHLKGENFLLSYLDEHGGCSTPGVLREVLGVSAPRTAAMLRALEEKLRLPVELYYLEGFKTREIAGMLGIPENTVKTVPD